MEFFRIGRTIPFMRHALVLNVISAVTFLAAIFFIVTQGFHLSIEFTGGTGDPKWLTRDYRSPWSV